MSVKKETTCANVTFLVYSPAVVIAGFAFINAQLSFILLSPDHFDIPQSKIGHATSKVLFTAYTISLLATPFAGYIYDIIGRRKTILFSMLANVVLLFIMPYTAPHIWLLVATRTMISLFNTIMETSPLVVDYIKKESRGTAVALGTIGMLVGEGFGMAVLLGLTIGMRVEEAHAYAAVVLLVLTITGSFCMREPFLRSHEKIE